jgi:cell division protein FtsQ
VIRRRGTAPAAGPALPAGPGPAAIGPAAGGSAVVGPAAAAGPATRTAQPSGAQPSGSQPSGSQAGGAQPATGGARRRTDPWKAAFFSLAAAAILAGAAWALLGSKFLIVRSVEVTGPAAISRTSVIAAAGIRLGTPLIRIDTAAVAGRVDRLTLVQSAQVRRAWPDKIVISVRERTALLAVASGRGYQIIDRFGVVLRRASRPPRGMPVLDTPAATVPAAAVPAALRDSAAVRAAATILRDLPARLSRSVRVIDAPSATAVTLRLSGGVTVSWGGTAEPAVKARELKILMRQHALHYDVSDPLTAVTGG